MKNHHSLIILAVLLVSCTPATLPPTIAPTRPTTAVPTLTPAPAPSAIYTVTVAPVLSIETIDFDLPDQIAEGIVIENFPELISPITDEPVPKHITLFLKNYSVESQFGVEVNIYLWKDMFPFAEQRRISLENVINDQASPQDYLDSIDLFGAEDIKVRPQKIDFQNGSGISYLYYWGVGPGVPVSNDRLIYTFDGLTDDNKYFVRVTLPVKVPFLDDSIDLSQPISSAPPGVIAYPDYENFESVVEYDNTLYSKLTGSDANVFGPSLDTLDTFISSLLLVIKE